MRNEPNFYPYILDKKEIIKKIVFIFPIFLLMFFLFMKVKLSSTYTSMIQEDTLIEYSQSLAYFIASVIAFLIGRNFHRRKFKLYGIIYILLSLCFLFIAMEEISWGQRIFNISTPEYLQEHNYQKEITVHNIRTFQFYIHHKLYILIGLFGSFSWMLIPRKLKKKYNDFISFMMPQWYLMFYFIPVFACYLYIDCVSTYGMKGTPFNIGSDQEPAEFILALGFLVFILINKYKQIYFLNIKKGKHVN